MPFITDIPNIDELWKERESEDGKKKLNEAVAVFKKELKEKLKKAQEKYDEAVEKLKKKQDEIMKIHKLSIDDKAHERAKISAENLQMTLINEMHQRIAHVSNSKPKYKLLESTMPAQTIPLPYVDEFMREK